MIMIILQVAEKDIGYSISLEKFYCEHLITKCVTCYTEPFSLWIGQRNS